MLTRPPPKKKNIKFQPLKYNIKNILETLFLIYYTMKITQLL